MGVALRALIIEDTPDDAELVALRLRGEGFAIEWQRVETERGYLDALDAPPDLILADWSLPQFSGMRALQLLQERGQDIPFIIVSGSVGEEVVVDAMRRGAHDYVLKDRPARLGESVRRALEEHRLREERRQTLEALQASERRYRTLFEGVSEIVFGLSAEGAITLLSPFFGRITGWPVVEWIGRPFIELIHPDDRATAAQAWKRTLADEVLGDVELRALTRTGAPLVLSILTSGRVEKGLQVEYIGFAHDVTERHRAAEDTRRRYAELSTLHRVSQQLLAAGLDPEQTYVAVHQSVAELMSCDAFVITLVDESSGAYTAVYLVDREGRWPARSVTSDGLSAYVISLGTTVLVDDLDAGPPFTVSYFGAQAPLRSILAVPFYAEGRAVGMLSAQANLPGAYDDHHRLLLETLAAQFAAAIRNAYLHQQEQARLHEMELVASVSAALRVAPTRAEMPTVILDQLLEVLDVEGSALEILDPASGDITVELGRGIWTSVTGVIIGAGEGLSAQVLETGQPYRNNDACDDPRLFRPELFSECRAAVGVPMIVDDAIIGLLWIGSRRPLTDHDVRVLTAVADIAANAIRRATLHEQFRAQARQMQQIVDTVPEGVLLLDEDATILLANPVAERHLTVLSGTVPGERLTYLGDRPLASYLVAASEGLAHVVEAGERAYEVAARPIIGDPEHEHWVMVIKDVTQERQIRRERQRQDRLAAVGQLAAGMAHDLNNILAVIVLYAHMAKRSVDVAHPAQRWMAIIHDQSSQATDLIQQMLDFSRRGDLQRQPLDLPALLNQQVLLLRRTLPESIAVTLEYMAGGAFTVRADSTRIQQVVTNLAVNARDAMPDGGELRIGLSSVTVRSGERPPLPEMLPGEWVRLTVADTGTGMPPEVREHLFEPFFTTKEPGKGTGLGLAQVYGIVGQHDGHIDVATQPGRGTTFTIYLPALSALPVAVPESGGTEAPRGQGQTVLLVEDNAALRVALVATLTDLGYTVEEAGDGEAALAQVEALGEQIELVLSDVVMPKMGGIALLRALRARGLGMPFILLTGHSMERQQDDLWKDGLSAWLQKPPLPGELAEAVARALRH